MDRIIIFIILISLITSCKKSCEEIDCAPCPTRANGIQIKFDTTATKGFTFKEIDSTIVYKLSNDNAQTKLDSTYINGSIAQNTLDYHLRLERADLNGSTGRYKYKIQQRDSLYSYTIKDINIIDYTSPSTGCCVCSYFLVTDFVLNDTVPVNGGEFTIRKTIKLPKLL